MLLTPERPPPQTSQSESPDGFLTQKELDPDAIAFNSQNSRYHFPARFYLPIRGLFGQSDPLIRGFRLLVSLLFHDLKSRTSPYSTRIHFPLSEGIQVEEDLEELFIRPYIYAGGIPNHLVDPTGLQDFPDPPNPPRGAPDKDPEYWSRFKPNIADISDKCPFPTIRDAFMDAWSRVVNTGPGKNSGAGFKKDLLKCFAKGIHLICVCNCLEDECAKWMDPSNLVICNNRDRKCGSVGASIIHELTHCAQGDRKEKWTYIAEDYYYPGGGTGKGDGTKY